MLEPTIRSAIRPLVFNSADWDLVQTQPFWGRLGTDPARGDGF